MPEAVVTTQPAPEPMQVGLAHLMPHECTRRIREQLCLYCGGLGHIISLSGKSQCSSVNQGVLTGATQKSTPSTNRSTFPSILSCEEVRLSVPVLLDSGADISFVCPSLVRCLGLTTSPLQQSLHTNALTGAPLAEVDTMTAPVRMQISGNHQEELVLYGMKSPKVPVVLSRL